MEQFSKLWDTTGKKFQAVGYNMEKFSKLWDTTWNNFPSCGIQHGTIFQAVGYNMKQLSNLWDKRQIIFCVASHNVKINPHCIISIIGNSPIIMHFGIQQEDYSVA